MTMVLRYDRGDWYGGYMKCRYYCIKYAPESTQIVVSMGRNFTQIFVRTYFMKYWIKIKSLFSISGKLSNRLRNIRKSR